MEHSEQTNFRNFGDSARLLYIYLFFIFFLKTTLKFLATLRRIRCRIWILGLSYCNLLLLLLICHKEKLFSQDAEFLNSIFAGRRYIKFVSLSPFLSSHPSFRTSIFPFFLAHTQIIIFHLSFFSPLLPFLPSLTPFASLAALESWLVYCWERGWCQEILTPGALSQGCDAGQDHVPDLGLVYFGSCSCCGAATSTWLLTLLRRLHLLQAGILPVPLSMCSKPLGSRGLGRELRDSSVWKHCTEQASWCIRNCDWTIIIFVVFWGFPPVSCLDCLFMKVGIGLGIL